MSSNFEIIIERFLKSQNIDNKLVEFRTGYTSEISIAITNTYLLISVVMRITSMMNLAKVQYLYSIIGSEESPEKIHHISVKLTSDEWEKLNDYYNSWAQNNNQADEI